MLHHNYLHCNLFWARDLIEILLIGIRLKIVKLLKPSIARLVVNFQSPVDSTMSGDILLSIFNN